MKDKLIVFDLDGVLFDSIGLIRAFTKNRFVDIPEHALDELFVGHPHKAIQESPWPKKVVTEEESRRRTEEYVAQKALVAMYPRMKELVEELASSSNLAINTYARPERSLPLLEREGIVKHFGFIGTYDPQSPAQTKIDTFKAIAKHYGIGAEDMLFVTDSLNDVREAAMLGIPTIAVTWGMHNKHFFEREPHSHMVAIVDTPEELKRAIDAHK